MKTSANIATFKGREKSLEMMLKSIEGQFDEIRIYDNSTNPDKADNGKFWKFGSPQKNELYFMLDDDLIYPADYVEKTRIHLENYPIVSYHGRILNPYGNHDWSYYSGGHFLYSYRNTIEEFIRVDVVGTGVCAVDTRCFSSDKLFNDKNLLMSDLVFSIEAAKQGIEMFVAPHTQDWIMPIHNDTSISVNQSKTDQRNQIEIVKEIMKLKNIL